MATLGVRTIAARPARVSYASQTEVALVRRLDWPLLAAVLVLCAIGALLVWSATASQAVLTGGDSTAFLKRHVFNTAIGLVLAVAVVSVHHRWARIWSPVVYVASLIGLAWVLIDGAIINGSKSWIVVAGLSIQPSEFAKLAVIVGVAVLIAERRESRRDDGMSTKDVVMVLVITAIPIGLVSLQPDLGTMMVMGAILYALLAVADAPKAWLFGILATAVVAAFLIVQLGFLEDYQLARLTAFTNPDTDLRGIGYNTNQARIAIGNGGVFGEGLFNGSQTQSGFVPAQHTDFVFTVAGEELGLVGAGVIIALFVIILWRILRIAMRSQDLFGRLVAAGAVGWFGFQAFENMGMSVGIMPVTGLPLPFVSHGGTSMFAGLMMIGLLQSIHMRSVDPLDR